MGRFAFIRPVVVWRRMTCPRHPGAGRDPGRLGASICGSKRDPGHRNFWRRGDEEGALPLPSPRTCLHRRRPGIRGPAAFGHREEKAGSRVKPGKAKLVAAGWACAAPSGRAASPSGPAPTPNLDTRPGLDPGSSGRGTTGGKREGSGLSDTPSRQRAASHRADDPSRLREGRETWRLCRLVAAGWAYAEVRGKFIPGVHHAVRP